jgi:hypothetical protein
MKPVEDALKTLEETTARIASEQKVSTDADYAMLQLTWNKDILQRSYPYIPSVTKKLLGIGSFMGALEISLSDEFDSVVCVDHKSYLPKNLPKNIVFHKANIDSAEWTLPSLEGEDRYDVVYFIETIEHLLWSPLPLLKWVQKNCHLFVISTPDDNEWPEMEIHPWTRYQHWSKIPAASPGVKGNPKPMYHTKQYTQVEFMEILDFVGFRVIEFFRTGDGKHQMVAICQPK